MPIPRMTEEERKKELEFQLIDGLNCLCDRDVNNILHVARYFQFKHCRTIESLSDLLSIVTGWYLHDIEMPIQKFLYSYPP